MSSVGQILVRGDAGAAVAAVDRALGRFGFRRHGPAPTSTLGPAQVPGARGAEVREFMVGRVGDWALFVAEDLESLFETAYAMHTGAATPVIAAVRFGPEWRAKAYLDRDLALKVGQDADRELSWVGFPLDVERAPAVARALGRGFDGWVLEVARGRGDALGLDAALGASVTGLGFKQVLRDGASGAGGVGVAGGWSYVAWAQAPWG